MKELNSIKSSILNFLETNKIPFNKLLVTCEIWENQEKAKYKITIYNKKDNSQSFDGYGVKSVCASVYDYYEQDK